MPSNKFGANGQKGLLGAFYFSHTLSPSSERGKTISGRAPFPQRHYTHKFIYWVPMIMQEAYAGIIIVVLSAGARECAVSESEQQQAMWTREIDLRRAELC